MAERFKVTPAVFVAILQDNKILLQQRQNTGWLDDYYDLPSGHLESGESLRTAAVRELKEEAGLDAVPQDLELFHISQSDAGASGPYMYFMFKARAWKGEPTIADKDKVATVEFFDLANLPEKTVPYVARALQDILNKQVTYSYFGKDK